MELQQVFLDVASELRNRFLTGPGPKDEECKNIHLQADAGRYGAGLVNQYTSLPAYPSLLLISINTAAAASTHLQCKIYSMVLPVFA